jgi:peptide/nickel transport system ATP-binding protein
MDVSIGVKKGKTISQVVRNLNLVVAPGEMVGIVGESGCGKSMTALAIPNLLGADVKVTDGHILFQGQDITHASPGELHELRGKELSMVFQEPMTCLNPLMRVGQQIAQPLRLHGETNASLIRGKVFDVMEQVGLPEPERVYKSYPHQLSGGQLQRAMIAIAIVCRPKLLICDEPTTALDVSIQAQILRLLQEINRSLGMSVLFISHDLGVIRQICNRVNVMYCGSIVEEGTVSNIFVHPVHEYTKGLMGSIPRKESKGKALHSIPGRVPAVGEYTSGCSFAPRCAQAKDPCFREFPQPVALGENHSVSCFLADPESEMEYVRI